ncbi:hypothetical protein CISIN_1g0222852mg, partial [Citrus sinensis]
QLPVESFSIDTVLSISSSHELPGDQLLEEISRVLKPGGTILIYKKLTSDKGDVDKAISALEGKLLLAGFLDAQRIQLKSVVPAEVVSFGVKGKKPTWKIGSSFAIKKAPKSLAKLQVDDDSDLIDEDTLLTEEDLKKPQLPSVGDCEVGSTRKACKNCICGRAEAEEKVEKLGLTMDQLKNPQSACGSVMWTWRCFPLRYMPLQGSASIQTGREGVTVKQLPRSRHLDMKFRADASEKRIRRIVSGVA